MARELMESGVQVVDPDRLDIRGKVTAGKDVCIDINVILQGENRLGDGVMVGAGAVLTDCDLAAGTVIHPHSVLENVIQLNL